MQGRVADLYKQQQTSWTNHGSNFLRGNFLEIYFEECQTLCQTLSKFLSKLQLNEKTWIHTEDQKKARFLKVINNLVIYKFFKEFIKHKNKTNRVVVLVADVFQIFLNIATTD